MLVWYSIEKTARANTRFGNIDSVHNGDKVCFLALSVVNGEKVSEILLLSNLSFGTLCVLVFR